MVHHWRRGLWAPSWQAVRYLLQYQCQRVIPAVGDPNRESSRAVCADLLTLDPQNDDLYVLTIAGIPAATAVVGGTDAVGRWYIGHICGHTRTGAGAMLLQHLQSVVASKGAPGLALSAFDPENVRVYRARGFRSDPSYADGREMMWDVVSTN